MTTINLIMVWRVTVIASGRGWLKFLRFQYTAMIGRALLYLNRAVMNIESLC